jgi:hypothetical protein
MFVAFLCVLLGCLMARMVLLEGLCSTGTDVVQLLSLFWCRGTPS